MTACADIRALADRYERELAVVYDSPYKQAAIARSIPAALRRIADCGKCQADQAADALTADDPT